MPLMIPSPGPTGDSPVLLRKMSIGTSKALFVRSGLEKIFNTKLAVHLVGRLIMRQTAGLVFAKAKVPRGDQKCDHDEEKDFRYMNPSDHTYVGRPKRPMPTRTPMIYNIDRRVLNLVSGVPCAIFLEIKNFIRSRSARSDASAYAVDSFGAYCTT